jgi:hypothetical protein
MTANQVLDGLRIEQTSSRIAIRAVFANRTVRFWASWPLGNYRSLPPG